MTVERTGRMVNITPKPRILKVLSRIEFDPWQCVAELVDNSFDEFLDIKLTEEHWNEPYQVSVALPREAEFNAGEGLVEVIDNGRGMTLERVVDAVSAGFSGNDPVSRLGLFGMGFNVATARMGSITRFLTTRAGDAEWVGVEIDLDAIREGYEVPEVTRPKDSPGVHGTRIEVARLEGFAQWFTRPSNQTRLRDTLGGVYSYLLDAHDFHLLVNGIGVKPYRHALWDNARTVTREGEVIPAVLEVDHDLGERAVCRRCGSWQELDNEDCEQCGSADLEIRERRVWGWLGIQRYLDPKQYGIDFLRNGRKILRFDKSLFQWRDPDDPTAQGDVEYPVELPNNQGRIVGEIHLDHVPVIYTKDSFDTGDRGWRKAVELIRGEGPLLPKRAKALGYSRNGSPLARLHRGFRRNDPGANYLTPGNGKVLLHTREWDKRFRDGDPAYEDDTRWWEAVVEHDRLADEEKRRREEREARGGPAGDDPTSEFGGPGTHPEAGGEQEPTDEEDGEPEPEPTPLTEAELVEHLQTSGFSIPELTGEFTAAGVPGRPIRVSTWRVREPLHPIDDKRAVVWLVGARGGAINAFVDVDHPHFRNFADDPADLVLIELAQHMLVRAPGATATAASVFAELKERYLRTHAIDRNLLVAEATQVLRDIQERMVSCVTDNPSRPWINALNDAERHLAGDRITQVMKTADVDASVESGDYLPLIPAGVVPRVVEEWPEAFLDGRLFDVPYADVASPSARRQAVASVTGYLYDVAWLASTPPTPGRSELIRANLSLRLLPDLIVPVP